MTMPSPEWVNPTIKSAIDYGLQQLRLIECTADELITTDFPVADGDPIFRRWDPETYVFKGPR